MCDKRWPIIVGGPISTERSVEMNDREKRWRVRGQLRRWGNTANLCRRKQAEIAEYIGLIDAAVDTLGAQIISGAPRGTDTSDPTAWAAQRAETLREAYRGRITELQIDICTALDLARHMDEIVTELPPDQQEVIDKRYKRRWGWGRIGAKLYISDRQAQRVEAEAVTRLAEYMDFERME